MADSAPVPQKSANWCGCPASVNTTSEHSTSVCTVCLCKFDADARVPIGLHCGHTICRKCARRLHPEAQGIPNLPLLTYLDYPATVQLPNFEQDCIAAICRLTDIAVLLKASTLSRAIHRKVLHLITSLTWNGQNRLCRCSRAVGERVLIELSASCSHLSHYHAQQQLWAAIRARACQFMGPAMQEEALKLVLLALEDGSPLSRKVLVMFVVQRLAPQFPQASKTSIGHVIQLLYRASCFDVTKRPEASSLMTLRPEYRNYDSLRREHDAQIVKIALESGIRFSPEQWSSILYGDNNHKPHMQSIIDKLQAPQTFSQMTTEFLVTIQRLSDPEDTNFLLSVHPRFQLLASIEIQQDSPALPWKYVFMVLEAVHCALLCLVSFNPSKTKGRPAAIPKPEFRGQASSGPSQPKPEPQRAQAAPRDDGSEIKELLAESRLLRARMKELQEKIPTQSEAQERLEAEACAIEEEVTRMVARVTTR